MTDKMVAEAIFKWLKVFMSQSNWLDSNTPDQARALFTSACFIGGIDADTAICDNMLLELYNDSEMESVDISYDEFDNYMVEFIV